MGTRASHEVDNGGYLLHQGEGMVLTHPQCSFESAWEEIADKVKH